MAKTSRKSPKSIDWSFNRDRFESGDDAGELVKIGRKLCLYLDAARLCKGGLPNRWRANEDCYNCDATTNVDITSASGENELPIWQAKCDRIAGDSHRQLTSVYPVVQCLDESAEGKNVSDIEKTITILADRGDFTTDHLRDAIYDSLNTNNAFLRVRPLTDKDSGEVVGYDIDSIHPSNVFVYPQEIQSLSQAVLIGHGFNLMKWEVDERIESGEYFDPQTNILGGNEYIGSETEEDSTGAYQDEMSESTNPVDKESQNVILYECLTKLKLEGDDRYRWYIAVVWKQGYKILNLTPYGAKKGNKFIEYPAPWYVKYCVKRSRDCIWSKWSPANSMQRIQGNISHLAEIDIQGTEFSAIPSGFIEGGGSLPGKSYALKAGTLLELAPGQKVSPMPCTFNPGLSEFLINFYSEMGDAATGVSRLGSAQSLPASTSATAAAGFLQAQSEAKSDYSSILGDGVESTWEIMFWILQIHAETILKANSNRLPTSLTKNVSEGVKYIRDLSLRFEATGSSGASNPQVLIQKYMMILQMTQGDPAYDKNAIVSKIIQLMDLPIQIEAIMARELLIRPDHVMMLMGPPNYYTPEEIAQELAAKLAQKDAMTHVQSALSQMPPEQAQQLIAQQQIGRQQLGSPPLQATPLQPGAPGPVQGEPGVQPPGVLGPQGPGQMAGDPQESAA